MHTDAVRCAAALLRTAPREWGDVGVDHVDADPRTGRGPSEGCPGPVLLWSGGLGALFPYPLCVTRERRDGLGFYQIR